MINIQLKTTSITYDQDNLNIYKMLKEKKSTPIQNGLYKYNLYL